MVREKILFLNNKIVICFFKHTKQALHKEYIFTIFFIPSKMRTI